VQLEPFVTEPVVPSYCQLRFAFALAGRDPCQSDGSVALDHRAGDPEHASQNALRAAFRSVAEVPYRHARGCSRPRVAIAD